MQTALIWFKRDLRVEDHEALQEARHFDRCICLYVYEDDIMNSLEYDSSHHAFLNESLLDLDACLRQMGNQLILKQGSVCKVFHEIKKQHNFTAIFSHEETGNNLTYQRDIEVEAWCQKEKVKWKQFKQFGVVRRLKKRDGWSRKWTYHMGKECIKKPDAISQSPYPIKTLKVLDFPIKDEKRQRQKGGAKLLKIILKLFF